MDTPENVTNDQHGATSDRRGYRGRDKATRELAFQLWLFECGRDCVAVARSIGTSPRNVQRWAIRDQWAERAAATLGAVMPDLLRQTAANFRLASYHAGRRLLALAIAADRDGAKLDPKEVAALVAIGDRGGFTPAMVAELELGSGGEVTPDPAPRSIEELIAAHHAALGIGQGAGDREEG